MSESLGDEYWNIQPQVAHGVFGLLSADIVGRPSLSSQIATLEKHTPAAAAFVRTSRHLTDVRQRSASGREYLHRPPRSSQMPRA
jgi:hypothetical protein